MNSGKMIVRSYEPFKRTASGLLDDKDVEAVEKIIGNDPFVGEAFEGSEFTFVFIYKGVEIHYAVERELNSVILLIAKPKDDAQKIDANKINEKVKETGKKWLGREIYFRIREWLGDNMPDDWGFF